MTRRRWIADSWDAHTAVLAGDHAAHLSRVLRARIGQQFEIVAGEQVRLGTIESIADDRVVFRLGEAVDASASLPISVLLAIFKFDRFEWAIEKLTELGVAEITPAIAARTESHLAKSSEKRVERWRRIALESSQQSRRSTTPVIHDPVALKKAAAVSIPAPHKIILAETEKRTSLLAALETLPLSEIGPEAKIHLAIGPEGGWTEAELQLFSAHGWTAASLGTTILRAETAAIAAVAVVAAWFVD